VAIQALGVPSPSQMSSYVYAFISYQRNIHEYLFIGSEVAKIYHTPSGHTVLTQEEKRTKQAQHCWTRCCFCCSVVVVVVVVVNTLNFSTAVVSARLTHNRSVALRSFALGFFYRRN